MDECARLCGAGTCQPHGETSPGPWWGDATTAAHPPPQPACPRGRSPLRGHVPSCAHLLSQTTPSRGNLAVCRVWPCTRHLGLRPLVSPLSLVSPVLRGSPDCGSSRSPDGANTSARTPWPAAVVNWSCWGGQTRGTWVGVSRVPCCHTPRVAQPCAAAGLPASARGHGPERGQQQGRGRAVAPWWV